MSNEGAETGSLGNRVGVIGGGAWGTALAVAADKAGCKVSLVVRRQAQADEINTQHRNERYLPGISLPKTLQATTSLSPTSLSPASLSPATPLDLLLIAVPAQQTRKTLRQIAGRVGEGLPVVACAKGFEQASGRMMAQIIEEELPRSRPAVLSGPGFAREVAANLPSAVTLACADRALGAAIAKRLGHRAFRIYWTDDLTGVQVGGSIKNVLAIAAGIVTGRKLGASAHAALITRGFAELVRIGLALGARAETLSGLSGLGDLILTCSSDMSRNYSAGLSLGAGVPAQKLLASPSTVQEGVYTASAVCDLARQLEVPAPISQAVDLIINHGVAVDEAIESLLSRPLKAEN